MFAVILQKQQQKKHSKNSIQQPRALSALWKAITESQEVLHFGVQDIETQKEKGKEDTEKLVIAAGCPFNVRLTHCLPKLHGIYVSLLTAPLHVLLHMYIIYV